MNKEQQTKITMNNVQILEMNSTIFLLHPVTIINVIMKEMHSSN